MHYGDPVIIQKKTCRYDQFKSRRCERAILTKFNFILRDFKSLDCGNYEQVKVMSRTPIFSDLNIIGEFGTIPIYKRSKSVEDMPKKTFGV